nr:hypothetical protein [Rhizobiaceae bacterium]
MHRRAFLARSAAALGLAAPALASPARAQALPAFTLQVGGNRPATIEVLTEPALEAGQLALVRRWVEMSAEALRLYYGRFPVPACRIVIDVGTYRSIGGAAYSGDIPQLEIRMPASASEQLLLRDDWVMTHEMTHLAFPWMRRRHNWLAEGLAVWVGSVVRVAAGHWPAEAMF